MRAALFRKSSENNGSKHSAGTRCIKICVFGDALAMRSSHSAVSALLKRMKMKKAHSTIMKMMRSRAIQCVLCKCTLGMQHSYIDHQLSESDFDDSSASRRTEPIEMAIKIKRAKFGFCRCSCHPVSDCIDSECYIQSVVCRKECTEKSEGKNATQHSLLMTFPVFLSPRIHNSVSP